MRVVGIDADQIGMFNFFVICRQSKWMKTLLMKETVVLCRHNTKTASPKAITWTATSASYFNSVHCHLIKTIFKSTKIIRTVFKVSTQFKHRENTLPVVVPFFVDGRRCKIWLKLLQPRQQQRWLHPQYLLVLT